MEDKLQKIWKKIFRKKNVVGLGFGKKFIKGKPTEQDCVQIYVTRKISLHNLKKKDRVPKKIKGVITDCIEVGEIKILSSPSENLKIKGLKYRKRKHRPAVPGISIGHPFITCGTLGAIVEKSGKFYILSNNHVLANSNKGRIGDITVQPGCFDNASLKDDVIGYLADYEPIKFENNKGKKGLVCLILKTLYKYCKCEKCLMEQLNPHNIMDAAISQVNKKDVNPEIYELGRIHGVRKVKIGETLQKSGRTTGVTKSEVISTNATVKVGYGNGKTAVFENQIMTGCMSKGGDSGSLCLDKDMNAVGLLFAGSEKITILNPIKPVLDRFGIKFVI